MPRTSGFEGGLRYAWFWGTAKKRSLDGNMASEDEVKALRPPSLLEVLDNRCVVGSRLACPSCRRRLSL